MIRWPFISRSTYDIAMKLRDDHVAELKQRIAKLEEDREKFVDILGGRAIGQSVYGRIVPPKMEEEEELPPRTPISDEPPLPKTPLQEDIDALGTKARALKHSAESRNMETVRASDAISDSEIERVLNLAREKGRERAEAVVGNGNH